MATTLPVFRLLSIPAGVRKQLVQRAIDSAPVQICGTKTLHAIKIAPTSRRAYTTSEAAHSEKQTSVNHNEVSHFNTLASSWWDPYGSSRLLHLMNPLRHQFLRRCLGTHDRNPEVKLKYLDVGCGGGIFAETAARLASTASVTAIDPTPVVIAVAKQHQRHDPLLLEPDRLTYLNTSIEQLQANDSGYDIITIFEVLEHIQHPSPFLTHCTKHLKPGGWIIGSTIARTPISWFTTKFVAEDVLGVVPRGTHNWEQYIQPQELRDWARKQDELNTSDGLGWQVMGVVYVPGIGWREVQGSESWGNYFFGIRKRDDVG